MLEAVVVECPYCGERFETTADTSGGDQDYFEDCSVCCQPIEFHLVTGADGELLSISTRRADDV
jgi:hypothetical protein